MVGKRNEKLQVSLAEEELEAIDEWRFATKMPSRAAAIRQLIHVGLKTVRSEQDLRGEPVHSSSRDIGVLDTPHEPKVKSTE